MKTFYALILASVIGQATYSAELDLVCVTEEITSSDFDVRRVIVGNETEYKTLQISSHDTTQVNLKRYAVVFDTVIAVGQPPKKVWEVLRLEQFSLETLPLKPHESQSWRFSILSRNEVYLCGINGTVHANPALTRSN